MSGGINFDTTSLGGGGNYGGYGYGGYGYGGNSILDIAALGLVFGDGFGRRHDRDGGKGCSCCAPATCEQVNDVDRDVLKCSFDMTEAMHAEARTIDRDVLMGDKCIEQKICDSTHKLEKDIWDNDRDILMGFKETEHRIDKLGCKMGEGFAEIKGLIKETALEQENKAQAKEICHLRDAINKKDTVAEILAALGKTPVIATV